MITSVPIQENRLSEPAPPKLEAHHAYRSWTTSWYDAAGNRRRKRFGKEGESTRKQATARYKHWRQTEYDLLEASNHSGVTIEQLADAYLKHARVAFAGKSHLFNIEAAMAGLKILAGEQSAVTFKGYKLAAVRDAMIWTKDDDDKPVARALKTVNGRLYIIKEAFRWAAIERGLVPEGTAGAMKLVAPLKRGRSEAKDPTEIQPVAWETVLATMNAAPRVLRDMIEVEWLTGMRSGELCTMRPCDIDRAKREYVPTKHKMMHKNVSRTVPIGPRAWRLISAYLDDRLPTSFIFSPAEAVEQMLAIKNASRKTAAGRGNERGSNVKRHPFIKPGKHYTPGSYRRAIQYACTRAGVARWHPHQARHAYGQRVNDEFSFDAAADALGHGSPDATRIYARRSLKRATAVARQIG